jgi:hypothetical protein
MKALDEYGLPLLGVSVATLALVLGFPPTSARADACTNRSCTYYDSSGHGYSSNCQSGGSTCNQCSFGSQSQEQNGCKD